MPEPRLRPAASQTRVHAGALAATDPHEEIFTHQRSGRDSLPHPEQLLMNLTRTVLEIFAGARDLEQINRWVTDDVYATLLKRTTLASRARAAKGQVAQHLVINIARVIMSEPCDGVVEAVVIVHGRARSRAVAIRLEGLDQRWRASAISVL